MEDTRLQDSEENNLEFLAGMPDKNNHFWSDIKVPYDFALFSILISPNNKHSASFSIIHNNHKVAKTILRKEGTVGLACHFVDSYVNGNRIEEIMPGKLKLINGNQWQIIEKVKIRTDYTEESELEERLINFFNSSISDKINLEIGELVSDIKKEIEKLKLSKLKKQDNIENEKIKEVETKLDLLINEIEVLDNSIKKGNKLLSDNKIMAKTVTYEGINFKNFKKRILNWSKEPIEL